MQDIIELIDAKQETKNCDFKDSFSWNLIDKNKKCELVKDIIAMANTQDGGTIIIGVEDGTFEVKGLSDEEQQSFDTTKVNDFLVEYTDPRHYCQVKYTKYQEKNIVAIEIPEFKEDVIICKKDGCGLERGRIYIRTDAAQSLPVPSNHEMRELIGRAITKKGDNLLASISTLIKGKPIQEEINNYDTEISEAHNELKKNINEEFDNYGYYELISYPLNKKDERVSLEVLPEIIRKASVRLRGRSFPIIKQENSYNTNDSYCSYFSNNAFAYNVRYLFNQNGLFISQETYREDGKGERSRKGHTLLSAIDLEYTLTEYILFLKRYYETLCPDENVFISLKLHKTQNRLLYCNVPTVAWFDTEESLISKIETIEYKKIINEVELRASYKDIIIEFCLKMFLRFNCNDISNDSILHWVNDLLRE